MSHTRFISDGATADAAPAPFVCSWTGWGRDAGWVHLSGELDLVGCPQLARTLSEALRDARLVVLDLRELTFMDSSGLHPILDAERSARHDGHRLMLVRGPGRRRSVPG